MLFTSMHKSTPAMEAGAPPDPEVLAGMGPLMEELTNSGALVAGEGLRPSSTGVRLTFSKGSRQVQHGPFGGPNGHMAGFTIIRTKSLDEAIDWASRLAEALGEVEIDIRPVTEAWDLGFCPKPEGLETTRFMLTHTAEPTSQDHGPLDSNRLLALETVTEQMAEADVLITTQSFQPRSHGVRLNFNDGRCAVTDGPFAESKELIAGFATFQLSSIDQAIEWGARFAKVVGDVEMDIYPLYESESQS